MNSDDLREIRDLTGIPYMSLYGLRIQIRQLSGADFPRKQIVSILQALHPQMMQNLKIVFPEKIFLKDKALIWIRRIGWVARI